VKNPNRPSEKEGVWDAKWFNSGYRVTKNNQNELECGCPDEMGCIHHEWPKSTPKAEATGMGFAAEREVVVAREQNRGSGDSGSGMGHQGQQSQQIRQVGQPMGQFIVGEVQQGDSDVGMDKSQPLVGGTAQGQHLLRKDNSMVMQYQSPSPTQEQTLQAGTSQNNREMGEQTIQQPQRNLPTREEHHALARQALDVMRSLEPPAEDDLGTFEKAVENSHASHNFSLHLGGRRGNSEKPVEKRE
jgi:hypothetical protein